MYKVAFEMKQVRFVALALVLGIAGCNTGSVTDGIAPTSQMRQTPSAPIGSVPIGNETALAAQQPVSSGPQAALAPQSGIAQQVPQQTQPTQTAALGGRVSPVAFLPVTGAPQSTVSTLAASMRESARREAVPVVVSVEQGARYQVKGYFSALNDGTGTILVYVWDVLDQNGTRVHRISGQERGTSSAGDPWAGISPDIIERVAGITMNSLRTWMSTRGAG